MIHPQNPYLFLPFSKILHSCLIILRKRNYETVNEKRQRSLVEHVPLLLVWVVFVFCLLFFPYGGLINICKMPPKADATTVLTRKAMAEMSFTEMLHPGRETPKRHMVGTVSNLALWLARFSCRHRKSSRGSSVRSGYHGDQTFPTAVCAAYNCLRVLHYKVA